MGNPLRDRRTPSELAASGQVIEISEKISSFQRLAAIVGGDLDTLDPDKLPSGWRDAPVVGELSFGFADAQEGLPALDGMVRATIDAVCQRCLEPLRVPLEADLHLLFADSQADTAHEGGYEVWEMDEEWLRPLDLVEEVLIMALPLVTLHEGDEVCTEAEFVAKEPDRTTRPFASLRSQMENEN